MGPGSSGSLLATPEAEPIIDVHIHAFASGPRLAAEGLTEESHRQATLAILRRANVVKTLVSGISGEESYALLDRWRRDAPDRLIPSMGFHLDASRPDPARLRAAIRAGSVGAIGEVLAQCDGLAPSDPLLEPYWALAEELDVPVGIYMGLGPPGIGESGKAKYRMSLSSPLLLEEVLARHPRLRVFVMHACRPMLDHMLGLLWAYPQVHVDVGAIVWALEADEFYLYLRRLVDAGFGDRIMFGSDQMEWPVRIVEGIDRIRSAPFLTPAQKRDILYNNAARFLRLSPDGPDRPGPRKP